MTNNITRFRTSGLSLGFIVTGVVGITASAPAQLNINSRLTTQRYGYVHGGGPDVHQADVTNTANALLSSDSMHTVVFDSTAGEWVGHTWATSVSADIFQRYDVAGPLDNASRITNSMTTDLTATAAGDIPTSSIMSNNPGNQLEFHFMVAQATDYHLTGNLFGGSGAFSYVGLEKFNGFNWEAQFWSFSIPGPDITWDVNGTLAAGFDYRLISVIEDGVGGNQAHGKSLNYDFTVVPEPASCVALSVGLLALRRRKRV